MFNEVGILYRGLVLGLMVAAPVGPVGLLCIRRTIQKGLLNGFVTGIGAACADTIFSAVAVVGAAAVLDFMRHYDVFIRIVGGLILLWGAWHTWHDTPKPPSEPAGLVKKIMGLAKEKIFMGAFKAFLSGFAITLTNPATIFGVLALIATFGHMETRLDAGTLIAGIFLGSAAWWIMLSGGITLVRGHFTESRVIWINRITAILLAGLALGAIASGFKVT